MSATTLERPALSVRGHWIDDWRPEDPEFWADGGAQVARRNLVYSIFAEHIGFSIWTMWSVLVLFLGPAYGIDPAGKFLLTAVPALVGATLRIPYTFAVARFGGRNWTIISATLLLIPAILWKLVYTPVALTVAALSRSVLSTLNPVLGFDTIKRMGVVYWQAMLIYTVLAFGQWVLGFLLSFIPILGGIVASFVDAYAYLAIGCTLGLAVFKKAPELGLE